jgi:2-methylcitrate dehydratase PrpD
VTPEVALARLARATVEEGPALAVMRLSLLDWAACALAGREEPVAAILRGHVAGEAGPSSVVGGGRVGPGRAALVNGTVSHALDYDDTHFAHIGHTSVAVVPAALAIGEVVGADLQAVTEAALVGSEAAIRVGVWLGRGHYAVGFHQTATAGAFGATVAAARLLGLSEAQVGVATCLAATRASGLRSQFGTMGKPYNAGIAAETGVEAALLAKAGMTAPLAGLSGPLGFGVTHHGAAEEGAFDGIGEAWLFPGVSHKFHACCHGLHAMLEAFGSAETAVGAIEAVEVATHPRWLTVCNIAEPRTGLEAKFSFRLTAAMRLSGVPTGAIASFSDAAAHDPRLMALRDRVTVVADEGLGEMQSRVVLRSAGREEMLVHDLDATLPVPERKARIAAKAAALIGSVSEEIQRAVDRNDLASLTAALRGDRG